MFSAEKSDDFRHPKNFPLLYCNTEGMNEPTKNYLQEFEKEINLIPADKGLRFVNFLIDYIAFTLLNYLISSIYDSVVLRSDIYVDDDASLILVIYGALISIVVFVAFYTTLEYYTKGRSLGKLVTNTVVIRKGGSQITFKDALLRSLCRLIPFEVIAALFVEPWHDSITNTTVVKKTWP